MNKMEKAISIIEKIKAIDENIANVQADHMDFNKEPKLKCLNSDRDSLLKEMTEIFDQNDYNDLEVNGIPNKDLYFALTAEIKKLERAKTILINKNFSRGYVAGKDIYADSIYNARIKPIDDCIHKYKDMATCASLLNAPNQNFVEAMEVLYDKEVTISDVSSTNGRLKLLVDTDMLDSIYNFYDVVTLGDKTSDINIDSNQRRVLASIVTEYKIRPILPADKLSQARASFDNLLNELYHMFDDGRKLADHYANEDPNALVLGSHEVEYLYKELIKYVSLRKENLIGTKIKNVISTVKDNHEIKNMWTIYEQLLDDLFLAEDKAEYQKELDQLMQQKGIFGKKKRINRINYIQSELNTNANVEKQLSNIDMTFFYIYFDNLKKALEAKGLSASDVSSFETWTGLSESIQDEIVNTRSNMRIDGTDLIMKEIVGGVFLPFTMHAEIAEDRMNDFNKLHDIKGDIDIIKVMQFMDMRKNYATLNNRSNALDDRMSITTITPYSSIDMADYYVAISSISLDKSYQELMKDNTKEITR